MIMLLTHRSELREELNASLHARYTKPVCRPIVTR